MQIIPYHHVAAQYERGIKIRHIRTSINPGQLFQSMDLFIISRDRTTRVLLTHEKEGVSNSLLDLLGFGLAPSNVRDYEYVRLCSALEKRG